jgi:hydrogenase expression/formation protein HypE
MDLADLESDLAPLSPLVELAGEGGVTPRFMRDLTRGGLAMAANDLAEGSGLSVVIEDEKVPRDEAAEPLFDLLGIDRYEAACEGTMIAVTSPEGAPQLTEAWNEAAPRAAVIGRLEEKGEFPAVLRTALGSTRLLEEPYGENLPRIC